MDYYSLVAPTRIDVDAPKPAVYRERDGSLHVSITCFKSEDEAKAYFKDMFVSWPGTHDSKIKVQHQNVKKG